MILDQNITESNCVIL